MLDAGILCSLEDLVGNRKQFAVRLQLRVLMPLCEKDWTQGFLVHLLNILELVLINMEKCQKLEVETSAINLEQMLATFLVAMKTGFCCIPSNKHRNASARGCDLLHIVANEQETLMKSRFEQPSYQTIISSGRQSIHSLLLAPDVARSLIYSCSNAEDCIDSLMSHCHPIGGGIRGSWYGLNHTVSAASCMLM